MRRLHRIGNSKEPTLAIMKKMAENLKQKYPKSYNSIQVTSWHTDGIGQHFDFWLSIEHRWSDYIKTWPKLLSKYRQLMKEAPNGS